MPENMVWTKMMPEERDRLIAEKIFQIAPEYVPQYSTSIEAAWVLIDLFEVITLIKSRDRYLCTLYKERIFYKAIASSPQEALCLAALRATGIEVIQ